MRRLLTWAGLVVVLGMLCSVQPPTALSTGEPARARASAPADAPAGIAAGHTALTHGLPPTRSASPRPPRDGFSLNTNIRLLIPEQTYFIGESAIPFTLTLDGGGIEGDSCGSVTVVCVNDPTNAPGWSGKLADPAKALPMPYRPGEYTYRADFSVHTDENNPDNHTTHATGQTNTVTVTVCDVALSPDPVVVINGEAVELQATIVPAGADIECVLDATYDAELNPNPGVASLAAMTVGKAPGAGAGRTRVLAKIRERGIICDWVTVQVTNLTLSVSQEYILADAQDTTMVTVHLGDGLGGDVPTTDVTLHTTGGTFEGGQNTVTVQTNQAGEASAILTSSNAPGEVVVSAEEGTSQTTVMVTFFTAMVSVSPATYVPNTTPVAWAITLGEAGEYVDLMLHTTPEVPTDVLTPKVTWTQGEAYPIPETDPQEFDPLMRRVSRQTSGMTEVTATVAGNVTTKAIVNQIVVVAVTDLQVETGLTAIDSTTAAAAMNATPNTYGVLKATVSPTTPDVSAVYPSLLTWTGGENGSSVDRRQVSLNAPSKHTITAHCGTSSASKEVFVIQVDLALPGVKEADETDPAKVPEIAINGDDDDDSDESDMVESPVTGEDDLMPLRLTILPSGLGGEVTLSKEAQTKLYTKDTKENGESAQLWALDVGEVVPRQLYVEGTGLSAAAGDEEFTLAYSWGALMLSDIVKATVVPQKVSSCHVKICKAGTLNGQPFPGESSYGAIGGTQMGVAIYITVGIGERLDPAMVEAELRIRDDQDSEGTYTDLPLGLNDGAGWWHKETTGWVYGGVAPSTANLDGNRPLRFIKFIPWNTQTTPSKRYEVDDNDDGVFDREVEFGVSHNGDHSAGLLLGGVFGCQMKFQTQLLGGGWPTEGYESGPQVQTACVKNLVITDVSTSTGSIDILKYDIDYDSVNNRPSVTFTVQDEGEVSQLYRCSLMLQPTSDSGFDFIQLGDVFAAAQTLVVGEVDQPKTVTLEWDGSTKECSIPDTAWTSTYAYDVMVEELDDQGNTIDVFAYKWPYCLTVKEHAVWLSNKKIVFNYALHDYAFGDGQLQDNSNHQLANAIDIKVFDENLNEYGVEDSIPNPGALNTLHNGTGEGIVAYSYSDYLFGPWRVVLAGEDACWTDCRRDRKSSRMLAANADTGVKGAMEALQFQAFHPKTGQLDKEYDTLYWTLFNCSENHIDTHNRIAIIPPGFGAANDDHEYKLLAKNLYRNNKGRKAYDSVIFCKLPTCTWDGQPRPFRYRTDQMAEAVALRIKELMYATYHVHDKILDFYCPCYGGLIIEMAIMEYGLDVFTNNFVTIASPLNGIPYIRSPIKGVKCDNESSIYKITKLQRKCSDEELRSIMNRSENMNVGTFPPNTNPLFDRMNANNHMHNINHIAIGGDQPQGYLAYRLFYIAVVDRLYGGSNMHDGLIGKLTATIRRNMKRMYTRVEHYNHTDITVKTQYIYDGIDTILHKWNP